MMAQHIDETIQDLKDLGVVIKRCSFENDGFKFIVVKVPKKVSLDSLHRICKERNVSLKYITDDVKIIRFC